MFYPDLLEKNLTDRITGATPTSETILPRGVRKDFDYARNPTIAVLGDPQRNDESQWAVIRDQMLSYRDALNIVMVNCVGDWVQQDNVAQYPYARDFVDTLVANGLPVFGPVGNHDFRQSGLAQRVMTNFMAPDHLRLNCLPIRLLLMRR